jgi:putative endonuclease
MGPEARRRAYDRGRRAERIAAWWLRLKGFRILERGFRSPVGEIDLIARRGGLLVFIEVKRRDGRNAAAEAVGTRQRRRIVRAAQAFLQGRPGLATCDIRFDALLISGRKLPYHVRDAWRADP